MTRKQEHFIDGVLRFQRDVFPNEKALYRELSIAQAPQTLFIGCADSRVVPELLTQQGPGGLFVVRNAGNIIPPYGPDPGGVTASIEYGVSVLGVPDIDQRHWYAFRLERNETGDFASLGRGWTTSETLRPVHLNDGTNVFDFIFQDGKVTASVNGEEVFHATAPPASVVVPGDSFSVGLGALTTANTVIRYRDVQVRKLD